jgi:lantibiotic modifying enzyme
MLIKEIKKIIRKYLKNKLLLSKYTIRRFHLESVFYDITIITAVSYFYKNNEKINFIKYYNHFIYNHFSNIDIFQMFTSYIQNIQMYEKKYNFYGKIAGDPHINMMKIYNHNQVFYNNILNIEKFIHSLQKNFIYIKNMYPKYVKISNICSRKYIPYKSDTNHLKEFYYNVGKACSLALFFKNIDMHYENIVCNKNNFTFIDLEFFFTPNTKDLYNIETTGLLENKTENNMSAILANQNQIISHLKPIVNIDNENKPYIYWKTLSKNILHNKPQSKDHPYKYIHHILEGYKDTCNKLEKDKKKIITLLKKNTNISTRILFRPTRIYKYITLKSRYPEAIQNNILEDYWKNELEKYAFISYGVENKNTIIHEEIYAMKKLCIPYFLCNIYDTHIKSSNGIIVGKMEISPFNQWIKYIDNFKESIEKEKENIYTLIKDNYINSQIK